ncbi:MbtH family NRPS accessory protein [Robbsia sp. Bb-Pol-6]|uniref:MbtH family NRPS accessory protein n=1 Tax=Robbsia betulipollinis TaxID=2981849 RepID=A0ABT3ZK95_9BURK|nr:MbtH family NRPS accessory protein [Robbsia betulipollinis]MCY0386842.1 MbtH family NRPS accessory protein [Robbsia betulipollinis]
MSWGDDDTDFRVVVNDEEQYSIWPDYKAMPAGWREAGKSGKKPECLAWIDEVWTDMRPLSLRRAMAAQADRADAASAPPVH